MLKMKSMFERKKILPLVLTLAIRAKIVVLSTFLDIRTPLTYLEDRFEGIDLDFFISCQSKSNYVNSFNAGRALERIGDSNYGMTYETLELSAIRQANIPTEREECISIESGYNKDGRPQCNQVVVGQIVNEAGIPISRDFSMGFLLRTVNWSPTNW